MRGAQKRYRQVRNPSGSEARKVAQDRGESPHERRQQIPKYAGRYGSNTNGLERGMPGSSTLSQNSEMRGDRRYFQRKQEEGEGHSDLLERKENQSAGKEEQLPNTYEKTNEEYLRLHEKLSHLEGKISEMKNNLQRKRQDKLKKKKLKEEEQRKKKAGQKNQKNRPVLSPEAISQPAQANSLKGFVTQVPEHKELRAFQKDPYSPRHNIYYVSEVVRAYKDEKSLAREHLQTSLQIMAYFERCSTPSEQDLEQMQKKLSLPRKKGYEDKKTVVFDLDETLIHCNESLNVPYDIKLPIVFPTGEIIEAGINIRPHAKEILKSLAKDFEVIVFTASHSCYANVVVDYLDPTKEYVHHRLFRENCVQTPEGMHVKDLRVIDRDLSQMVLVDNAAYSYIYQLDNGIPILPYYHGNQDFELKTLEKYIRGMLLVGDVRKNNRKTFKLSDYKYYDDLEALVEELYLVEHDP